MEILERRTTVVRPKEYSMFLANRGDMELDANRKLASYNCTSVDVFEFRQRGSKSSVVPQRNKHTLSGVFGVPPETLPCVEDLGYKVPKCLMLLREAIYEHNACREEGLFRLAGNEQHMNCIIPRLNRRTFRKCEQQEVHACATLIKRWFADLPKRLFSSWTIDLIENCSENGLCDLVKNSLSELYQQLFFWFIEVLVDVARFQDTNKMTPQNLSIVVAPILADVHKIATDPIQAVSVSGKFSQLIAAAIENRLKERLQEATSENI